MAFFIYLVLICSLSEIGSCANTESVYYPPIALQFEKSTDINAGSASTGVALCVGSAGKVFIAIDSPPQIISLDSKYVQNYTSVKFISDLCIGSRFTLIYTDNSTPLLFRTDLRLNNLNPFPLEQFNRDILQLKPSSITASSNGNIYFSNAFDQEIWVINQNGLAFKHSNISGAFRLTGKEIEFITTNNFIVVLDNKKLKFINQFGKFVDEFTYEVSMTYPTDLTVSSTEIWISGNGIECYSIITHKAIYILSSDELNSLGLSNISAIAIEGDSTLYLLSATGNRLINTAIVRENSEK